MILVGCSTDPSVDHFVCLLVEFVIDFDSLSDPFLGLFAWLLLTCCLGGRFFSWRSARSGRAWGGMVENPPNSHVLGFVA